MASRWWWNTGQARRFNLGHPEGLLDVPQVVVGVDHAGAVHGIDGQVGYVALQGLAEALDLAALETVCRSLSPDDGLTVRHHRGPRADRRHDRRRRPSAVHRPDPTGARNQPAQLHRARRHERLPAQHETLPPNLRRARFR